MSRVFRATPQLPAFISAPDVTAGLGKPARGKSTGDDGGASTLPFSAAPAISGDPGGGAARPGGAIAGAWEESPDRKGWEWE